MTPKDFHPHAPSLQFTGAHCPTFHRERVHHFAVEVCTDPAPCGFHRQLAELLATAFKQGRESANAD